MNDHRPFRTTRRIANLRQGRNDWYRITNNAGTGLPSVLHIYDEIGFFGVTATDLVRDLAGVTGDLEIRMNCPGGDVFEGIAIFNALHNRQGAVGVAIDGLAASAASFIAQAASPGRLQIAKNASMMIHDAFGMGIGNSKDLHEFADLLDRQSDNIAGIYADRSGRPVAQWREAMRAETWYVGQEAVDAGLADYVPAANSPAGQPAGVVATWDLSVFAKRPGVSNADKYNADDRKRMASSGEAMPDGSYPIADGEDLDNAIHAVGRGGADHDAIRRHIIKRAAALGLSSRIPDNWSSDGSLKSGAGSSDNHYDGLGPEALSALTEVLAL